MPRPGVIRYPPATLAAMLRTLIGACLLALAAGTSLAREMETQVPLRLADTGGLYVTGYLDEGVEVEFLVDTGAGLAAISRTLLERLDPGGRLEPLRRSVARLANGRRQVVDVYRLEHLRVGAGCELGPVEVAVMARSDRNILGLGALRHAAPFGFSFGPPTLRLTGCRSGDGARDAS